MLVSEALRQQKNKSGCCTVHTINPETGLRSGFATNSIVVDSVLFNLIDLLNLASSKYTILPSAPLKEEGRFLKSTENQRQSEHNAVFNRIKEGFPTFLKGSMGVNINNKKHKVF